MAFPKIIWPSGGGNTLQFIYPPRFVPFRNYKAIRHDNLASSGVKEFVYERRDEFLPFTLEYAKIGADVQAWDSFVQTALQGSAFDYYPDANIGTFTTYTLEDTSWDPAFKSLGLFGFKMVFRKRVGWPAAPPAQGGTNSFSDSFTRTNGDIGTGWLSQLRGDVGAGVEYRVPSWQILANKLRMSANGNVANQAMDGIIIPRTIITSIGNSPAGLYGKNQFAKITFQAAATSSSLRHGIAVLARSDSGGSVNECQGYHLMVRYSGGAFAAIELLKRIGGQNESGNTFTVLATNAVAPVGGDTLELDCQISSSITLTFLKNGTQVYQAVDNSPLPAVGYPVVSNTTTLGTGALSDWTNFSCGPV